jgi:hypothetical protein
MGITLKMKITLILVEYVGWDVEPLSRSIDELCVTLK